MVLPSRWILLAAALACVCPSGAAFAAAATPDLPERPVVTNLDDPGGDPRIALSPVRFEPQRAEPGVELRFPLKLRNTTRSAVTISALAIPVEGSDDPDKYAQPAPGSSSSAEAAQWVSFPGFGARRTLPARSELTFVAAVRVPEDARPGTYAIGLAITQRVSAVGTDIVDAPSTRIRLAVDLASVAVLRVPGEATARARILDVDAPRFVWGGEPRFEVRVENVGDTDLVLDGQVVLGSFLTSAGRTLDAAGPERGYPTLPGGERVLRMRWSDPPLLGWYQPELVVVGGTGSGVRITDNLDTIWVLPPWWLILLFVLALLLPLHAMRRRRRDPRRAEAMRERATARVEDRLKREKARRRAAEARARRRR